MKVILNKDVKNLGKVGDLVNVAAGYARNFLFPRLLATEATETRVREFEHLKKVAEIKKKKAVTERKDLAKKLSGTAIKLTMAAGEGDRLFGAVTTHEVSNELEKAGFSIDRRDIHLPEQIKVLGSHKALIKLGEGIEAEIAVVVERRADA